MRVIRELQEMTQAQLAEVSGTLPWYDFCRSVLRIRGETDAVVPAIKVAKAVGGVVMTLSTCYLIERWKHLALNAEGIKPPRSDAWRASMVKQLETRMAEMAELEDLDHAIGE